MNFYLPTKVFCERGAVRAHSCEWTALGKKALIITGKSSAANGSLQDVKQALDENGVSFCVFDETEENPSIEMIMRVRDLGLSERADFVIGIGGGSPMDAAKAAALMIRHGNESEEYLYRKGDGSALPVVEVPTTCGTGSEVTPYSILTVHEKRTKSGIPHRIYPKYALVDGAYLESAGQSILVNTAVDTLGHFIESYINANTSTFSRMFCLQGMELWGMEKQVLSGRPASSEDYDRLMLASTMAGMAITHTGTALPHGLSYYFTYESHIPHGKAVGYFLSGYLANAEAADRNIILEKTGFSNLSEFSAFIRSLTGPLEADQKLVDYAVNGMLGNESKLKNVPFKVTEQMLYQIFDTAQGKQ